MSGNYPPGNQPGPYDPNRPQGPYGSQSGQQPGPYGGSGGQNQPYPGGSGQPPVGSPGTPSYSGPGYGGGYGQQGPGQPGQRGPGGPGQQGPGQPGGPRGPYGGGYPQSGGPGGQPPQKSNARTLIIVGAVVLLLIIGGVVTGVALLRDPAPTTDPGPTTQSAPNSPAASSSAPAPAAKASDAVKSYLDALATGQADAALALSASTPADPTFLTDEVLAQSLKRAPLTDISVPDVDDEYAYKVDATYQLGKQTVSDGIYVEKKGDGWKVKAAYAEVDLQTVREKTLPLSINGVAVKANKVRLFPGSYEFSTGSKNITYGDEGGILLIETPDGYPEGLSDLRATLSSAGDKAFTSAVKASLKKCLAAKELAPKGCPNQTNNSNSYKIDKSTLKWKLRGSDPTDNLEPRLDYQNPVIASASFSLSFEVKADCNAPSGTCEATPYASGRPRVNMLEEPLKVTWSD